MIERVCKTCGKSFWTKKYNNMGKHGTYCSRRCRARSKTQEEIFWTKVKKTDNCWIWTGKIAKNRGGYGKATIRGTRKQMSAHRLSWILHYGSIPEGLGVLHKCDNPPCVRPDHLFLGTRADNFHDCMKKGRRVLPYTHKSWVPRARDEKGHSV